MALRVIVNPSWYALKGHCCISAEALFLTGCSHAGLSVTGKGKQSCSWCMPGSCNGTLAQGILTGFAEVFHNSQPCVHSTDLPCFSPSLNSQIFMLIALSDTPGYLSTFCQRQPLINVCGSSHFLAFSSQRTWTKKCWEKHIEHWFFLERYGLKPV